VKRRLVGLRSSLVELLSTLLIKVLRSPFSGGAQLEFSRVLWLRYTNLSFKLNNVLCWICRSKIQRLQKKEQEKDPESKQWNLLVYRRERKPGRKWLVLEIFREVFVPILVLVVGVFCSAVSLTTL